MSRKFLILLGITFACFLFLNTDALIAQDDEGEMPEEIVIDNEDYTLQTFDYDAAAWITDDAYTKNTIFLTS